MFKWIIEKVASLIPPDYSWGIAAKKATYMAGKGVVAILAFSKVKVVSSHLTPEQITMLQTAAGAMAAAAVEGVHDYLKMKFPGATWL